MDHHTWWGGQTEGTTKKENRVLTIDACGQALRQNLGRSKLCAKGAKVGMLAEPAL